MSDISLSDEMKRKLKDWSKVTCGKCGKKAHYTSECVLNRLEARARGGVHGVHGVHWINPMD